MKRNIKQTQSIEIDLVFLMKIFWNEKWKILAITFGLFLSSYIYSEIFLPKKFIAITEIMPVNTSVMYKYAGHNNTVKIMNKNYDQKDAINKKKDVINETKEDSLNLDTDERIEERIELVKINRQLLYDYFIDILEEKFLFEKAIYEHSLLDANMYNNETEYKEAISKFTSSIKILSPNVNFKKNKKEIFETQYTTIQVSVKDTRKWKEILKYMQDNTNKTIQNDITKRTENYFSILKLIEKHRIEDTELKITNLVSDYKQQTYNRILFLKEQAAIARQLDIKEGIIETKMFNANTTFLSHVLINSDINNSEFYMRGYEAIEKEIELIKSRNDEQKKAFINGLFKVEKEKRALMQNKILERAELNILNSPLYEEDFYAATIKVGATKFISSNDNEKLYLLAIILGLIIGMMYAFIISSHRFR